MELDSRATVLYVDDEELARKYFAHLAGARYRVLTAAGVDQALALLAESGARIDVLVTDYRMPGRLGSELLPEVERHYPHIVCMLATAYADKQVLLELINAGSLFRLLEKPLETNELLRALELAVQAGRARAARRLGLMAIDESLAFLEHELNTPLAAVANFARGIERRATALHGEEAEIAEAAALMHDNARYCLAVLASFVDTVRLAGSGIVTGTVTGSSARQLLAGLLDSYPMTPGQRACITLQEGGDFAIAESPHCVSLILSSVLGSGLRALEGHASPAIVLAVTAGSISVRSNADGGAGPELAEHLLRDPLATAGPQAPGWNLIFCKRMMQSFGGTIVIATEHGISTTVTLNFPVPIRNEHD
ncbi:response regulator [Janthinobacterium sp. PSPC3-1]|uniref:response regulator n=1 Tax=Janthinobacterium sp. PSPC3-1 TaxID=2804653 RepID=UPI003CF48598